MAKGLKQIPASRVGIKSKYPTKPAKATGKSKKLTQVVSTIGTQPTRKMFGLK